MYSTSNKSGLPSSSVALNPVAVATSSALKAEASVVPVPVQQRVISLSKKSVSLHTISPPDGVILIVLAVVIEPKARTPMAI